jgi:TonB-linked SusC/RagA family outer membrane protein
MKRCLLQVVALLLLTSAAAYAQTTVTGTVTSAADGSAVPGASVLVKGTATGTSTDAEGNYSVSVPDGSAVLVVSFIGFATQEVAVLNNTSLNIILQEDIAQLGEVVVTALGIEKDTKGLGYSVTNVKGDELVKAREINVGNVLVGKIAGVNSAAPATGPGGSSRVIIRGNSSLSGNNQPLYVINGIQINNDNQGNAGMWGGADMGDGLASINPDDIEDITVLKGASASALYGQRGKNGVILITTKSGKGSQGLGIELNTNTTFDKIHNFTDFQNQYGQGTQGNKPLDAAGAKATAAQSWGAPLDGSMTPIFDGSEKPYSYNSGENLEKFYQTGFTSANTIAISHGSDAGSIRFSAGSLNSEGVYRGSDFDRVSVNLDASYKLSSKWSGSANINYSREKGNRSNLSDSPGNGNYAILFLPPSMDANWLAPGYDESFNETQFNNTLFDTNPWFAADRFKNRTMKNRVLSVGTLRYAPTTWLFIQGRVANDYFSFNQETITPTGTAYRPAGSLDAQNTVNFNEMNADFLVGVSKDFGSNISLSASIGGNILKQTNKTILVNASNLNFPFLYNPQLANTKGAEVREPGKEVQSLYASAEVSFKDMLFLTVTDRNDWSSTLPAGNNSYNYPSVSAAFVFTEILKNNILNFGKIRAGFARVGGDADPFALNQYYGTMAVPINGIPLGNLDNAIPNPNLEPLQVTEVEIGANLQFLNNRIWLDVAYYNKQTLNDIIRGTISQTSGYDFAIFNVAEIENKGVELLIGATPVKTSNITWTTSFNYSHNKNKIVSLIGDLKESPIEGATARTQRAFVSNVLGMPYGQVMAFDLMRDDAGNAILGATGLPQSASAATPMGTAVHPITGGWNNEISYKRLSLAFLIDFKSGGVMYSGTNAVAMGNGLHKETLKGRDGGILVVGVDEDGDAVSNTITAQNYWGAVANVSKNQVYDSDFVKFRSVSLTYTFPSLFNNKIQSLSVSLVGRNLFYFSKHTDNIDPEANYQNGNGQGLEFAAIPTTKTFGVNINAKF